MTKNENFESRDENIKVAEEVSVVISKYITYTFGRKKFRPPEVALTKICWWGIAPNSKLLGGGERNRKNCNYI